MYAAFILRRHRFGRSLNVMSFHTSKGTKNEFKEVLKQAKNIVFLTGAGTSAESGIPTFRGAGGLWRQYQATDLATPGAFKADPSLVWEFYSYRREVVLSKQPNKAHFAMAAYEKQSSEKGKHVTVITQNIDGLHQAAGSKNVLELHGSLFKTRCLTCGHIEENRTSPIVPALAGKGEPDVRLSATDARIPVNLLPRCSQKGCGSLLRPHVVWFGENLEQEVLEKVQKYLAVCDACLLVGTSSVVYPAAGFAPQLAARGVPVAEFNLEETPSTGALRFHFQGAAGETLPPFLEEI